MINPRRDPNRKKVRNSPNYGMKPLDLNSWHSMNGGGSSDVGGGDSSNMTMQYNSMGPQQFLPGGDSSAYDQVMNGYGGLDELTMRYRILMEMFRPQQKTAEEINALVQAKDPVAYYNRMRSLPSDVPGSMSPFATGFFKGGAQNMSREAILASQGRTAENQWAQAGAYPSIDVNELRRQNAIRANRGV